MLADLLRSALIRANVILPAHIELDGKRQRKHEPVEPWLGFAHPWHGTVRVEEFRQQAEIRRHRQQEQRDGEDQTNDQQASLFIDLIFAGDGFGILRLAAKLHCFEPGGRHCAAEFRLGDDRWDIFDAGFLVGVGHLRFQHTFQAGERLLETPGIVVIRKPLDDQVGFAGGDAIPGAVDPRNHIGKLQLCRLKIHGGALGGQVHDRALHAIQFLQVALHRGNTVGAGHAGDR